MLEGGLRGPARALWRGPHALLSHASTLSASPALVGSSGHSELARLALLAPSGRHGLAHSVQSAFLCLLSNGRGWPRGLLARLAGVLMCCSGRVRSIIPRATGDLRSPILGRAPAAYSAPGLFKPSDLSSSFLPPRGATASWHDGGNPAAPVCLPANAGSSTRSTSSHLSLILCPVSGFEVLCLKWHVFWIGWENGAERHSTIHPRSECKATMTYSDFRHRPSLSLLSVIVWHRRHCPSPSGIVRLRLTLPRLPDCHRSASPHSDSLCQNGFVRLRLTQPFL